MKFVASRGLPRFIVKEVIATVANGMITTTSAKAVTSSVTGRRHLPSSTILGRVDLPETVMYCFLPTMNVEKYITMLTITISDTASVVPSVSPSGEPTCT